jgi:hypothetical protein
MALNKATIDYPYDPFREFAMQHQLVREEVSEVSIPNLLAAYLPLSDCTCGKQKQRSPNCVRHHASEELRDLSTSLVQRNKHNDHHRVQILHVVKVAPRGDMEFLQIYLAELPMGVRSDRAQNAEHFQMTRPWWREN